MSNTYTLRTLLSVQLQAKVIQKILLRGASIGCSYMKESAKEQVTAWCNPDEATTYIINMWESGKRKNDIHCFPGISILFNKEVWFDLWFREKANLLAPTLRLNRTWYKHRDDQIDFEKYIRLFLELTQDYTTVWIKTYDEWGDLDLYDEHEESYPRTRDCPDLSLEPCFKVDVTLDAGFNYDTLSNLLHHGEREGWRFFYQEARVVIDQAIAAIFEQSPSGQEVAYLTCFIGDMTYQIGFSLRFNKFFMFTLTPLNTSVIPFRQTVERALDLCTDFIIFELNTFDARYNYVRTVLEDF